MITRLGGATLLLAMLSPALQAADHDFSFYIPYLPDWVNAAVVVDAEAFYNSALAQKENWAEKRPFPLLPPSMVRGIMGGKFDPASQEGESAEMALGSFTNLININKVAQRENGAEDVIAGKPAVLSSRGAYLVQFDKRLLGMYRPANRQDCAKWIRHMNVSNQPLLSQYLQKNLGKIPEKFQIAMAIDLSDTVPPATVLKTRVAAIKCVADCKMDVDALVKELQGTQGVRLMIAVDKDVQGEIRVDFTDKAESLKTIGLTLLQEVLARRGLALPDLETWKTEVDGNAIIFRGPLSLPSLRHLLSFIAPAPPPSEGDIPAATKEVLVGTASASYLNNVLAQISDLKASTNKYLKKQVTPSTDIVPPYDPTAPARAVRKEQDMTAWYRKAADRITSLNTTNVDKDFVEYGQIVAMNLRAYAYSLEGNMVQQAALEKGKGAMVWMAPSRGWGGYGWGGGSGGIAVDSNISTISTMQAEAAAKGGQARLDIWKSIDADTYRIIDEARRKYKIEPR